MKYQKKKVYKKKAVRKVATKSIKKQLMRLAETKIKCFEDNSEPMFHQTPIVFSPTQCVTQGQTVETRIGDSIYLQNLTINGFIQSSSAANAAQKYRVLVYWSKASTTATAWTSPGYGTDIFLAGTYSILANGIVNPKAVTLLADMVVDINCSVSTASELKTFNLVVPLNQKFDYQVPSGSLGKFKNLFIGVIPFIAGGTTGITAAGTFTIATAMKFKDF